MGLALPPDSTDEQICVQRELPEGAPSEPICLAPRIENTEPAIGEGCIWIDDPSDQAGRLGRAERPDQTAIQQLAQAQRLRQFWRREQGLPIDQPVLQIPVSDVDVRRRVIERLVQILVQLPIIGMVRRTEHVPTHPCGRLLNLVLTDRFAVRWRKNPGRAHTTIIKYMKKSAKSELYHLYACLL